MVQELWIEPDVHRANSSLNAIDNANWVLKTTGYMPYTSGALYQRRRQDGFAGSSCCGHDDKCCVGYRWSMVARVGLLALHLMLEQPELEQNSLALFRWLEQPCMPTNMQFPVQGAYSGNLTNYQNESVTTAGCGGLTGVTLAFNMTGQTTVNVGTCLYQWPSHSGQATLSNTGGQWSLYERLHNGGKWEPSYTQQCARRSCLRRATVLVNVRHSLYHKCLSPGNDRCALQWLLGGLQL